MASPRLNYEAERRVQPEREPQEPRVTRRQLRRAIEELIESERDGALVMANVEFADWHDRELHDAREARLTCLLDRLFPGELDP